MREEALVEGDEAAFEEGPGAGAARGGDGVVYPARGNGAREFVVEDCAEGRDDLVGMYVSGGNNGLSQWKSMILTQTPPMSKRTTLGRGAIAEMWNLVVNTSFLRSMLTAQRSFNGDVKITFRPQQDLPQWSID